MIDLYQQPNRLLDFKARLDPSVVQYTSDVKCSRQIANGLDGSYEIDFHLTERIFDGSSEAPQPKILQETLM